MFGTTEYSTYYAKVFFYSPANVVDLVDYTVNNILYVESSDISNITITTAVNETAGNFSMTFQNNGLKFMRDDNIERDLEAYNSIENSYNKQDAYVPRTFNYFRHKDDFLNFKHETVIEGNNRYRVHYEITPADVQSSNNIDKPLDHRSNRWFFRGEKPAFINVVEQADGKLKYYDKGTGKELRVEVHTNKELYDKYGGNLHKVKPIIQPMDLVCIFFASSVDSNGEPEYIRVFTGVVNKISHNRRGSDTLTIDGEDITKFLRLSVFATNPARLGNVEVNTGGNLDLVYDNNLSNKKASDIIKQMVLGTPEALMFKSMDSYRNRSRYTLTTEDVSKQEVYKNRNLGRQEVAELFFTANKLKVQGVDPALDNVAQYKPYRMAIGARIPDVITEYKDRLQICRDVAKTMGFEFFADPNGVIIYRQPQYDNYHILNAKNPNTYVLYGKNIHDFSISDDDGQVVTNIRVTGVADIYAADPLAFGNYADVINKGMASKFGVRIFDTSSNLVLTSDQCRLFGKSLMRKINADVVSGQVTLDMRPTLKAGESVFIPEVNRIFYATTVTHSFSGGSVCTTSIGLQYGRVPWDILPELLTYYKNEKNMTYTDGKAVFNNKDDTSYKESGQEPTGVVVGLENMSRKPSTIEYFVFHHNYKETNLPYDIFISGNGKVYLSGRWLGGRGEIEESKRGITSMTELCDVGMLRVKFIPPIDGNIFYVDPKHTINSSNTVHIAFMSDISKGIDALSGSAALKLMHLLYSANTPFSNMFSQTDSIDNRIASINGRCMTHNSLQVNNTFLCGSTCSTMPRGGGQASMRLGTAYMFQSIDQMLTLAKTTYRGT